MIRRKFLTQEEVSLLLNAATGATADRDRCLILLGFRHGMRVSELLDLRLQDLDLRGGRINIRRLKNGFSTVHPLMDDECRALQAWLQVRSDQKNSAGSDLLFPSRRGTRLSRQHAYRIIRRYGELAGSPTAIHPHMLRHACGYELAERGADTRLIQDYLGHRNIRHTVRYTASNAGRFVGIWDRENRLTERKIARSSVPEKEGINGEKNSSDRTFGAKLSLTISLIFLMTIIFSSILNYLCAISLNLKSFNRPVFI